MIILCDPMFSKLIISVINCSTRFNNEDLAISGIMGGFSSRLKIVWQNKCELGNCIRRMVKYRSLPAKITIIKFWITTSVTIEIILLVDLLNFRVPTSATDTHDYKQIRKTLPFIFHHSLCTFLNKNKNFSNCQKWKAIFGHHISFLSDT